nr:MAG TPA: hypothetical protein [Caudoviricetes sp.]
MRLGEKFAVLQNVTIHILSSLLLKTRLVSQHHARKIICNSLYTGYLKPEKQTREWTRLRLLNK